MGQQQLLLVILVTIIVGIATVVAINTFGTAADSAAQDAARQDILQIASSSQSHYLRPAMLGGGARAFDASNGGNAITFNNITFPGTVESDTEANNENASYVISAVSELSFLVTATVNDSDGNTIAARICADNVAMGALNAAAPTEADCLAEPDDT